MKNFKLSPHFTFFEMTRTDRRGFLQENREKGLLRLSKLAYLAMVLEGIRGTLGTPLRIHSAYRSDELNAAIGGARTSQHRKAEAVDWSPGSPLAFRNRAIVLDAFERTVEALKRYRIMFGQIIFEEKSDRGGATYWIHLSLGAPFRPLDRCGEVLRYKDGQYLAIDRVDFSDSWG